MGLKNYIREAYRSIRHNTLYGAISIFCLSVGITGAILILMYLNHELGYDTHHRDHERIFRMEGIYDMAGNRFHLAITPFPMALALKDDFAHVESYARFYVRDEQTMVRIGEKEFLEEGIVLADSTVFDVFTHHFIHGHHAGALSQPNTAVLSRSLSEKYFGDQNPVGETMEAGDQQYVITAVVEDLPENSHFRYHGMLSMASAPGDLVYSLDPELYWDISFNYTYVKLAPGHDIASLREMLPGFAERHTSTLGEVFDARAEFLAVPLRDTHFREVMMAPPAGSRSNLVIFSLVAAFLVAIAAINYTNLATARATKRAREIGIRKVNGATRSQLIIQFLTESTLIAVVSLFFSIILVELLLPMFNSLAATSFSLVQILESRLLVQVLAVTLVTGLAAGAYPAMVLSRMKPAPILKGMVFSQKGSSAMRKALVVFQFAISILLVTATITVRGQLHFLQNKPLGFAPDDRAVVRLHGTGPRQAIETLEQRIAGNPMVRATAKSFSFPGHDHSLNAVRVETDDGMRESAIAVNYVDHRFTDVLEIDVLQGRPFDPEMRTDHSEAVLVNERAVSFFGWGDDPIGKRIQMRFDREGNPRTVLRVIGVVSDFNYMSLSNPIEPMMLVLPGNDIHFRYVIAEFGPGKEREVSAFLEETVREFDPSRPPEVFMANAGFAKEFDAEERMGRIFGIFALVTILLSFLGLYGLSSFTVASRRKEIGIRKVLGSSPLGVLKLLYRQFALLVLIAVFIAAPVSWFLMDRWLADFVYHIPMSLSPIVRSAIIALVVAVLTVSFHTIRAARMNPVDSIQAE